MSLYDGHVINIIVDEKEFMDEGMKADDRFKSHVQHVTKDEDTHRYMPKGSDPDETYQTPENHYSPWLKNWIQHGIDMENGGDLDALAVSAVIHAQVLKRPQ